VAFVEGVILISIVDLMTNLAAHSTKPGLLMNDFAGQYRTKNAAEKTFKRTLTTCSLNTKYIRVF
jgi:hypothetical protein